MDSKIWALLDRFKTLSQFLVISKHLKASQRTQHVIPLVVRVYLHKKIQMQPQPKII